MDYKTEQDLIWQSLDDAFPAVPIVYKTDLNEELAKLERGCIENALDAGATRISVEIQAGGRSLIRVTDNGKGMSRDDALLCLERHATSKINLAEI